MQIHARIIDDFKTERKDISPPLQAYLRLVPVLLYAAIAGSILLNALFIARYSQAGSARDTAVRQDSELNTELDGVKSRRQALEDETKKASDLSAWVEASRPLQSLVVEIARSMGSDASLVDLSLERDTTNPAQILLSMRLQSENPKQLDETVQTIARNRFRTFSPQQTMEKGVVDYKATLLWQSSAREQTAPAQ